MNTALFSLYDAERQGERIQRVYTPPDIVAAVRRVWPEGIALDPCSGPDSVVGAEVEACPDFDDGRPRDGLSLAWPERTYCNPPYDTLETWLDKASSHTEVLLLGPVRTHRRWFAECVFAKAASVCFLWPITFIGFEATFPAPLCMVYWGRRLEAFRTTFAPLGCVLEMAALRPTTLPPPQQGSLFGAP